MQGIGRVIKWACGFVALGGAFACATTVAGQEEARPVPSVPSGFDVTLQERLIEDLGSLGVFARYRFVVPGIAAHSDSFALVEADFAALCQDYALPDLAADALTVDRIVVSFAAAPIEFGATDPDIVQFFEVFQVVGATCIWEGF